MDAARESHRRAHTLGEIFGRLLAVLDSGGEQPTTTR
jgi:hypothetical protein